MGPQYTYKELDQKLKRYGRKYRRYWMRADYLAYWKRSRHGIELRAGWRCTSPHFSNGERLLLLYPDGRIAVSKNAAMPYERYRLNHYFPFNKKWCFWWWRGGLFISRIREGHETNDGAVLLEPRYTEHTDKKGNQKIRSCYIMFDKNGEPVKPLKGRSFKSHKRKVIKEDNARQRPRKRGWYWARRSRNIYRNHSMCVSHTPWIQRDHNDYQKYNCRATRWESQPPQTYDCGCVTWRKTYKRKFGKTVKQILDEPNATVRSAWMQIYGIQKFFEDAGSTLIDHHGQYKLLQMDTGGGSDSEIRRMIALKMTCPSTGTVYINSVPGNISNVSQALDWMYDIRGYLGNIGQQT